MVEEEDATHYPTEFLNSVDLPSIPPHELLLKHGIPIMLMRNMAPPKLCNGTRLIVKKLLPNLIEAEILTGTAAGETTLIPRIPLIPSDSAFSFKRIQFPVKPCFALTINKAQGQSFNTVGVHLTEDCFSHGQLYVACSRATDQQQLFLHSQPLKQTTKNVVYPEVFDS